MKTSASENEEGINKEESYAEKSVDYEQTIILSRTDAAAGKNAYRKTSLGNDRNKNKTFLT